MSMKAVKPVIALKKRNWSFPIKIVSLEMQIKQWPSLLTVVSYQTIYGFGAAFTDTTGQMLKSVNESLAELILNSYFSENGIEYSIARVPLAGTDFSDRPYSYDDVDGDIELKHFALQKKDIEWKVSDERISRRIPHWNSQKLFSILYAQHRGLSSWRCQFRPMGCWREIRIWHY